MVPDKQDDQEHISQIDAAGYVAGRWPTISAWAHGQTVSAPDLVRELRDALDFLGAQ